MDLFNLVTDPAFLLVAWVRVRGSRGARTAGVDGRNVYHVEAVRGGESFLGGLRSALKDRSFRPLPVRERMIPKADGKLRRLGFSAVADRVVQASLKLVFEPICEADFHPSSYGFRPKRRAHDAVAEVRHLTSRSFEWVVEGDITACFDEIAHAPLMDRVRMRVGQTRPGLGEGVPVHHQVPLAPPPFCRRPIPTSAWGHSLPLAPTVTKTCRDGQRRSHHLSFGFRHLGAVTGRAARVTSALPSRCARLSHSDTRELDVAEAGTQDCDNGASSVLELRNSELPRGPPSCADTAAITDP
ncbi:hypothetical protein QFZ66_007172 [Streptomyces sp. B4I13]|uniref:reverse transcriptase domain-containing protein n=1 Tax=Streptomyces sp. B4I13 TaxID=3042271 RepID=UPI00277E35A8|nr:reverse transcriptase domain-containing protein [Streptomyces sp. B4I13]MDQ0963294.1 hypothetical protein [Streptomyces sp. B4I13]